MSTALDVITGALRKINVLAAGEVPNAQESADALAVLNDLLDTWSTEHLTVFNNSENLLILTPGKTTYTVGNPITGTFLGSITAASATITGVTVPVGLIIGSVLTAAGIPAGTKATAVGANTVTMSVPATAPFTEQIQFTTPGDFPIDRPMRVTNVYTRITSSGNSGIDYPCDIWSIDEYSSIGLKGQPGPWPRGIFFNPGFPYATISVWPVPTMGGELHMWTDNVFSTFVNMTDVVQLPQGYSRAIKLNLALELAPEYGKRVDPLLVDQARKAKASVKALNANPMAPATYDSALMAGNGRDAGWVLHGGFS